VPTYSYACTDCGNRFDVVQAFTDEALTTCQQCSGRLRKLFHSVGVVFKGSGFYRTDSRESTKNSTDGKSGASPSSDTSDASAKATASPAASPTADSAKAAVS
jgi:putative FmdB family regulatory protein